MGLSTLTQSVTHGPVLKNRSLTQHPIGRRVSSIEQRETIRYAIGLGSTGDLNHVGIVIAGLLGDLGIDTRKIWHDTVKLASTQHRALHLQASPELSRFFAQTKNIDLAAGDSLNLVNGARRGKTNLDVVRLHRTRHLTPLDPDAYPATALDYRERHKPIRSIDH
jgi:hypothetical protein